MFTLIFNSYMVKDAPVCKNYSYWNYWNQTLTIQEKLTREKNNKKFQQKEIRKNAFKYKEKQKHRWCNKWTAWVEGMTRISTEVQNTHEREKKQLLVVS